MIAFVKDYAQSGRRRYDAALDALIEPVRMHLPDSIVTGRPKAKALNVRYFTVCWRPHKSVFVSHGIADKRWRDYEHVKAFPYIFHSGPRWQAKYLAEGCPPEKLYEVGYAKLDPAFDGSLKRADGPRVIWAPTHERGWPKHYPMVEEVIRGLGIHESPHPLVGGPRQSTLQALIDADVVIADAGSTLYEAWALGKPVVFPRWLVERSKLVRPQTFETEIYQQRIGRHATDEQDLVRLIDEAREHGITQAERDFIEGIFPTRLRGVSGKAHADALRQIHDARCSG